MKIPAFLSLGALTLTAAGLIGTGSARAEAPKDAAQSGSVTIPVKGMSCMSCVANTTRTLKAVPGVSAVEVKLSPGSATVKYDPATVTPDKLAATINDLGYKAGEPAEKAGK